MKKRSVLIILVALTLLSTILLSSILGVTKAEYFKKLSKALDFEAMPDVAWQYALWDGDGTGKSSYSLEEGVYKNAKSFSQEIVVGRKDVNKDGIYTSAEWLTEKFAVGKTNVGEWFDIEKYPDVKKEADRGNLLFGSNNIKYNGKSIAYQIKLPVDEAGYYLLNFQVDFRVKMTNGKWASESSGFYTQHYDLAIGCEILNHDDIGDGQGKFKFMTKENTTTQPNTLDLYSRSKNDTVFASTTDADAAHEEVKSFSSDSSYQWKTLAPSRAENVSLAFKVEQADVDNGYVIWMWELDGLYGGRTWQMEFNNVSVEKTMDLNGSTKTRNSSVDPYFMFPQTSFINSQ
jgi:hypothetical protein